VPRLSIIVPHRRNDARLEATLVSVLENRPEDSEILVVHDGSYRDPYNLSDEVIFIEEPGSSSTTSLLNSGLQAACAPAICVLLDGVVVSAGWCEAPLSTLLGSQIAAVALPLQTATARRTSWGVGSRLLSRASATQTTRIEAASQRDSSGAPVLACGFYRRKILLALGGWNTELEESVADVELAMTLAALELDCQVAATSSACVSPHSQLRKLSATSLSQFASLMVAHGAATSSWSSAMGALLRSCLQAQPLAGLAWSRGLRNSATIRRIQLRLNHARRQLSVEASGPLRVHQGDAQTSTAARRAA